jgi:hypothetical protein
VHALEIKNELLVGIEEQEVVNLFLLDINKKIVFIIQTRFK